jgi:alpha-D-glucose phosphate-specific phosphoglucomutase
MNQASSRFAFPAPVAIKFGTSGWRGIMGKDFNFAGVRRASAAVAGYLKTQTKTPKVLIGYDTRFLSDDFARACAVVLGEHGCKVSICGLATPTPAIAFAILRDKYDGAVNFTASHNPADYNGLKFNGADAGPALPEVTREIEKRAAELAGQNFDANGPSESRASAFERVDLRDAYLGRLTELVRFETLRGSKLPFVFDALHGAGAGWLDKLLADQRVKFSSLRTARDVTFNGTGPDPSEENLAPLREAILQTQAAAGIATDGDADRFGILDSDGSFVSPNHILALLFDYLIETRGAKLGASRSVATSHMLDAVAKLHGVPLYETPVGFKYVGDFIRKDAVVIGGEESAGLTGRGHVPEKDGLLACLLVAEMVAARHKSLRAQIQELFGRIGAQFWSIRVNLHLSTEIQAGLKARLGVNFQDFAGRKVQRIDRTDGCKLLFADGSWILMRPSGTEPVVRVYAEAATPEASEKLAQDAQRWINSGNAPEKA